MSECAWQRLGIWLISANPDLMKPDWAEILAKEWDYWAWSLGKHLTWGMTRQTKHTIVQMCTHATLHTHIYTDIVCMFCKITATTSALQHRLEAFKEVVSGMVSWDGTRRGKERPVCMWDGQTESDYSTGKHPLAAVLTETRHMTHKSHIGVVSTSWKTLSLCLSSNKNISLFHICRVCRYWIHNAGKVSGKLLSWNEWNMSVIC